MSDPFVAEIRIFGFNFPPKGWAFCNGQVMSISQNTALFSLIGTTYGGDGMSTFVLPNLQGAAPLQAGQGPGLSLYDQGQTGGAQEVTLTPTQMPSHQHSANANIADPTTGAPANQTWAIPGAERGLNLYHSNAASSPQMSAQALSASGGDLPHNNMPPFLTLSFCIALQGIFPPRS